MNGKTKKLGTRNQSRHDFPSDSASTKLKLKRIKFISYFFQQVYKKLQIILNWVRIRRFLVFSSTGPGSKELYRKNAEPEQLPTPTKKSFSLSPGAEPVLKEGIRSKRKNENIQVPDPDSRRFFHHSFRKVQYTSQQNNTILKNSSGY